MVFHILKYETRGCLSRNRRASKVYDFLAIENLRKAYTSRHHDSNPKGFELINWEQILITWWFIILLHCRGLEINTKVLINTTVTFLYIIAKTLIGLT